MTPQEETDQNENAVSDSRRKFLKLGLAGAGLAAESAVGVTVLKKMEGVPLDHFPLPVIDDYNQLFRT